jgi:hypothetical protein
MPKSDSASSSKKRPYPFDGDAEKPTQDGPEFEAKKAKKQKAKEPSSSSGHFVMTRVSEEPRKGDIDGEGIEDGPKLLDEDKKEISDLLDDIEARKRKKREKRAMRQKNPPAPKQAEPVNENSIEYLKAWHSDRSNWKFKSAREAWLIRHYQDLKLIPDDVFELLVPYFVSMKGGRRDVLRKEAKAFTKKFKKEVDDFKTAAKGTDSYAIQYRRCKAIRKALRSDE